MAPFERFKGTDRYIVDADLAQVVDAAIVLRRPLLVRGEPGTGKTLLAHAIAEALGHPLIAWHIKSTTKAVDGLYTYDVVQRLNDSRFGDRDVADIRRYVRFGPLGRAFTSDVPVVVLIDEIDKADIESSSSRTISCASSTKWRSTFPSSTRPSAPATVRSPSSRATRRRSFPTPFSAAACSTRSRSPTAPRWSGSSACTIRTSTVRDEDPFLGVLLKQEQDLHARRAGTVS
jgi:hypothetical protein